MPGEHGDGELQFLAQQARDLDAFVSERRERPGRTAVLDREAGAGAAELLPRLVQGD